MDFITRSRKQNCNRVRSSYKTKTPNLLQVWKSLETPPLRDEVEIEQGIEECIHELQISKSYLALYKQLERQPFRSKIQKVLGKEKQFQMVLYGLGNIESNYKSKCQLAFALQLRKDFDWIGEIQVYDPVLKAVERQVIEKLGCKVLSVNEQAKREANVPTLFFMPHCPFYLYNNLVKKNWDSDLLTKLVILGNSFNRIQASAKRDPKTFAGDIEFVFKTQKLYLVEELPIKSLIKEFSYPFNGTSWHFFHVDSWVNLKSF